MLLKQTAVKILAYTVKARLCYSFFKTKMSKRHNKNHGRPFFSSCRTKKADGGTQPIFQRRINVVSALWINVEIRLVRR